MRKVFSWLQPVKEASTYETTFYFGTYPKKIYAIP